MTDRLADSHLHIFRRGMPAATGRAVLGNDSELDAYEAFRRKYNIVAGLVVGYDADGIDPGNSAHILSLAQTRPWMATLAYVEPDPVPDPNAIEKLLEDGHRGLALYATDPNRAAALSKWPDSVWDVLNRRRAIISFNARPAGHGRSGQDRAPPARRIFSLLAYWPSRAPIRDPQPG